MKRRFVALVTCIVLSLAMSTVAFAKLTPEYVKDYERVLFGKSGVPTLSANAEVSLEILEDAVYLAVDSYNNDGEDELQFLQKNGVNRLPSSISELTFTSNSHHERYTHMGWEYSYTLDKGKWHDIRKPLLINAVNKALSFPGGWLIQLDKFSWFTNDESAYDKKCVSFAALLYYIHILGDHAHNTYTTDPDRIPLGHSNPGVTNRDVLFDLEEHLAILFADQSNEANYKKLMSELDNIGKDIRGLAGARVRKEDYEIYQSYAGKVIEIGRAHV